MSDHKFEHQVGQKLNDLKIAPTAQSWQKIEDQLRERKRRPAPVFWLPFLLLGIIAGGYFFYNHQNREKESLVVVSQTQSPSSDDSLLIEEKTTDSETNSTDQQLKSTARILDDELLSTIKPSQNQNSQQLINENTGNKNTLSANRRNRLSDKTNSSLESNIGLRKNGQHSKVISDNNDDRIQNISSRAKDQADQNKGELRITTIDKQPNLNKGDHIEGHVNEAVGNYSPETSDNTIGDNKEKEVPEVIKPNAIQNGFVPEGIVVKDSSSLSPIVDIQHPDNKKSSGWSFGVTASGGLTSVNQGKILSFTPVMMDAVAIPSRLYYAANAALPTAKPSKVYPGIGFSLGVTAKKEISRRFTVSAAINYLRISTVTQVGYKVERTSNAAFNPSVAENDDPVQNTTAPFYLPTENYSNDYVNKYNFIELPITLHTRINRSEKLPIYWNAGVGVSKLLGSNSLHYDSNTRLYFQNNDLLNDVQTSLMSGFSFALFNHSEKPLWIGPAVRYNITRAVKKDIASRNKHFMGVGLDVKWFFN